MGELPPKLFFRIGEVAGLVGVEPHVLRYWEREFRSIRPTKSAKGQRVYSRKDVENLLRVRDLLYRDGFTIAGAKKKLQRSDEPTSATSNAVADTIEPTGQVATSAQAPQTELEELREREHDEHQEQLERPAKVVVPTRAVAPPPRVREKLVALRSEVEAFLAELSTNGRR